MAEAYGGLPKLRGLEVIEGVFSNIDGETKFGHAHQVTNVLVTVWSGTNIYTYPSDVTAMTISSDDVADDVAGAGALTAKVWGLDGDWAIVEQTATLTGKTEVALPTSLRRVYRIEVLTAGGNGANVGDLYVGSGTVTDGVPANIFARVDPDENQTLMSPYTVPAGKHGVVTAIYASVGGNKNISLKLVVRKPGEVFRVRRHDEARTAIIDHKLDLPITGIPAMSDIEIRVLIDSGNQDLSAAYDLLLIDD